MLDFELYFLMSHRSEYQRIIARRKENINNINDREVVLNRCHEILFFKGVMNLLKNRIEREAN